MGTLVRPGRHRRSAFLRVATMLALTVATSLALASPATAQDADTDPKDEQIVLSGQLLVAEGETVDSAVIRRSAAASGASREMQGSSEETTGCHGPPPTTHPARRWP